MHDRDGTAGIPALCLHAYDSDAFEWPHRNLFEEAAELIGLDTHKPDDWASDEIEIPVVDITSHHPEFEQLSRVVVDESVDYEDESEHMGSENEVGLSDYYMYIHLPVLSILCY